MIVQRLGALHLENPVNLAKLQFNFFKRLIYFCQKLYKTQHLKFFNLFICLCWVLVAICRIFSHCMQGLLVVACSILSCGCKLLVVACGIQFPGQGSNPDPLHWECIVQKSSFLISAGVLPSLKVSSQFCSILDCQGCHNKILQLGWLKQQNKFFHSFEGWKSKIKMSATLISPKAFLTCTHHVVVPLCMSPWFLFFIL